MQLVPRIFCLTLPGSTRHLAMKEKLQELDMPYEFFYGNRPSATDIAWKDIDKCFGCSDIYNDILNGMCGCKYGHTNMIKKALQGTEQFFIFCQDDIGFKPGFKENVLTILDTLYDEDNNIFNLGYYETWWWFRDYNIPKGSITIKAPVQAGDQCYLMDRKGAELWLQGLLQSHKESDLGVTEFYKSINKNVTTFIHEHSLITMDDRFHMNSSIANGHQFN